MSQQDEDKYLIKHEYDGIQEYDNPMPLWLNLLFVGTVIFSVGYMFWFHGGGGGVLPIEAYEREMAAVAEQREAARAAAPAVDLEALAGDPEIIAAGRVHYDTYCAACHGATGEGLIGPALNDDQWVHGGDLADIVRVVADGVLDKGMPGWDSVLGPERVRQVSVYVKSLSE